MKTFARKSVSILLSVLMIISLFTIIPMSAGAAVTYTVQFTYNGSTHTESNVTSLPQSYAMYGTISDWFNTTNAFRPATSANHSSTNTNVASASGTNYNGSVSVNGVGTTTLSWRDRNYYNRSMTVTVTANNSGYDSNKNPSGKSNLTYTGSAQTLVNTTGYTYTEGQNTFSYRFSTNTSSTTQPQNSSYTASSVSGTNAGTYRIWWIFDADSSYSGAPAHGGFTVTIGKANAQYTTAPAAVQNLTYNGSAQALVTAGTSTFGSVQYSLNGGAYSTTVPTATNAGTYTVSYKVDGTDNYNGIAAQNVSVTIAPATLNDPTVTAYEDVYDADAHNIVVESTVGDVYYSTENELTAENYQTAGSATNPTFTDAGEYTVNWIVYAGNNYSPAYKAGSTNVTITKDDVVLVAPTANELTYTTEDQELVLAGSVSAAHNEVGGTLLYKLIPEDDDTDYTEDVFAGFSEEIPTAKAAGTYTVAYGVKGDKNHNDIAPETIEVEIEKATPVATIATKTLYFNGQYQELVLSAALTIGDVDVSDEAKLWYALDGEGLNELDYSPVGKEIGSYDCYYRIEALSDNVNAVEYDGDNPFATVEIVAVPVLSMTDYTYGTDLPTPTVTGAVGDPEITYLYYPAEGNKDDAKEWKDMTALSVDAGDYKMFAEIAECDTAVAVTTEEVAFTVGVKTVDAPTIVLDPEDNTYTGEAIEPTVTVKDGDDVIDASEYTFEFADNTNAGTATVTITDAEGGNYTVSGETTFEISKADLTLTLSIEGWTYGDDANAPELTGNAGEGEVTYLYKVKNADDETYTEEVPVNANEYTVKAEIAETDNYNAGEVTADFTIAKADIDPAIFVNDWTYGATPDQATPATSDQAAPADDTPGLVTIIGNLGDGLVKIYYKESGADDNTYSEKIPVNAGDYDVKLVIDETENYNGNTATTTVTIHKADPVMGEGKDFNIVPQTLRYNFAQQELVTEYVKEDSGLVVRYSFYPDGMNPQTAGNIPRGKAIGTYDIYYMVEGNDNYNDYPWVEAPLTAEIIKALPEVAVDPLDATYGDTLADVSLPTETDGVWAWDDAGNTPVGDAGEQKFSATYTPNDSDIYGNVTQEVIINVAKALITPEVTINDWSYHSTPDQAVVTGNAGDGDVTFVYAKQSELDALDPEAEDYIEQYEACWSEEVPEDADDYVVSAKIAETDNYEAAICSTKFAITKADFDVSVTMESWAYGDEASEPQIIGYDGDGEITFTYAYLDSDAFSAVKPIYPGNYTVKAEITDTNNSAGETVTADFAIYQGTFVFAVTIEGWTYGDEPNEPEAIGNTSEGEVTFTYAPKGSDAFTAKVPTEAGDYVVKATVANSGYYDTVEATAEFTIAKADIAPTVTLEGWTYGEDANEPQVEGNNGNGEVTYSYAVFADYIAALARLEDPTDLFSADVPTDANEYIVKAVIAESDNYNGGDDMTQFTIAKADIDPSVTLEGWTYGDEPNEPEVSGNDGNGEVTITYAVKDSDEFTADVPTEANVYTVKAEIAETANYNGGEATADFLIDTAASEISVSIEGWTYGEDANEPEIQGYDGDAEATITYAVKGSDEFTADVPTDANDYTVKVAFAETNNYSACEATADFTIAKADIAPTVTIEGWTYGDDANEPEVTGNTGNGEVTYSYAVFEDYLAALFNKEDTDALFSADVPTDANSYVIKATIAETDNYNGGEDVEQFTIAKADIAPTVTIAGWTYGDDANEPEVTGNTGNGEVTITYAVKGSDEFSADVPTDANDYTVKAEIAETDNYNAGEATADFTIAKADSELTVTLEGWTYGEDANKPEIKGYDGDAEATITYAVKGSDEFSADVPVNANDYTVKVAFAETNNYSACEATADFTIAKAPLTVTARNQTVNYGDAPLQDRYTVKGLVGDDQVTVSLYPVLSQNAVKATVTDCDNYQVKKVNGMLGLRGAPIANALPGGGHITVKWTAVNAADGFDVYAGYCGTDNYKKVKSVEGNAAGNVDITKIDGKAIDTSKNVFIYVIAYKNYNGSKVTLVRSASIRVAGEKSKNTNAKKVTVTNSEVNLTVGATSKISAKATLVDTSKKLFTNYPTFSYASSNKSVATVDENGKITAVAPGTANVYVYTQNGVRAKVAVTVEADDLV